jgi:hypothetical protein
MAPGGGIRACVRSGRTPAKIDPPSSGVAAPAIAAASGHRLIAIPEGGRRTTGRKSAMPPTMLSVQRQDLERRRKSVTSPSLSLLLSTR